MTISKAGLRKSGRGCCPVWLQQDRNSPCGIQRVCARYGGSGYDTEWMDHTATWTVDRKPGAITAPRT